MAPLVGGAVGVDGAVGPGVGKGNVFYGGRRAVRGGQAVQRHPLSASISRGRGNITVRMSNQPLARGGRGYADRRWPHRAVAHAMEVPVITLGVILLIIGFVVKIPVLWTIGIVLAVIGLVLVVLGAAGRKVGGRAHYF